MWRPMIHQDLKNVFLIADAIWGFEYHESYESYEDKFLYYPQGCMVYEEDRKISGYIFWFPWKYGQPPALNTILDRTTPIDSFFIHDIVLDDSFRGKGLSKIAIDKCLEHNKVVTLVAANRTLKTKDLWKHFGFVETDIECDYGVYMLYKNHT